MIGLDTRTTGRPKQAPTLSKGRSPCHASGVPHDTPGRAEQGSIPSGDRLAYPRVEGLSSPPGRPEQGPIPSKCRWPRPAVGVSS